jgi:hypothetical protein
MKNEKRENVTPFLRAHACFPPPDDYNTEIAYCVRQASSLKATFDIKDCTNLLQAYCYRGRREDSQEAVRENPY